MVECVYPAVYEWYIEQLNSIFDDCTIYEMGFVNKRDIAYPAVFVGPVELPRELYLQELKNFAMLFHTVLAQRQGAGDLREVRAFLFKKFGEFVSRMDRNYFNLRIETEEGTIVRPFLGDTVETPELSEDYAGPFAVSRIEWVYSVEFVASLA